jgi:hypothetical protein
MKKCSARNIFLLSMLLILGCFFLVACGSTGNTAQASDAATASPEKTPTVQVAPNSTTPTPNVTAVQAVGTGKDYAFVRDNQVWVALNGQDPVQATNFTGQTPPFTWSQLHWFAHDRYLAFTVEKSARGGNQCLSLPLMGQIFVIDTTTMKTTSITTSGPTASQQIPLDGLWSALTVQDDTHLLARLDGQGIYQYDFTTQTMTQLISQSNLPAHEGQSIFSLAAQNGQAYYGIISTPDATGKSHLVIYSHPLASGNASSTQVFDAGSEITCNLTQQDGPIMNLPWDISPDGTHLVTLAVDNTSAQHPQGKVELVDLKNGNTTTAIFTQMPLSEGVNSGDITLLWSPDSQHIMLESNKTLYTSSISDPSATQTYEIQYQNHVSWNTNGTSFATDNVNANSIQLYTIGTSNGTNLLTNATDFVWGIQ